MQHQHHTAKLAVLGLLLACGSAQAAPSKTAANANGIASQPGSSQQAIRPAARERIMASIAMQAGDASAIASAPALSFQAIARDREFTGELIVRAKRGAALRAAARVLPVTGKASAFADEVVIAVPAGVSEGEFAGALMATGDYEFVEPNWLLFPADTVPNDPQYSSSWQHSRLQSAAAWDITQGSSSVVIAVCDSGVDSDHPDLEAALVPGYNAVDNTAQIDGGNTDDVNGHGTFVAGCAAAIGNNGRGVVGAGWNMRVMPIRVSNNSGGTANSFDILEGARWAAANGAKVVNASFTGATSGANNTAARDIKAMGGIFLWASGNDGANVTNGNLPDLTIVGSTSSNDNRSGFSNYGTALDIVAPGSGVRSTSRGGGYSNGSGTSYASPVAAGVAGMIFSANENLSPDDVQDVLYSSVDDRGTPGYDIFYGHGRVNTFNAVTMAQAYTPRFILPLVQGFESGEWSDQLVAAAGAVETVSDPDAPSGSAALAIDAGDIVETVPLAGGAAFGNNNRHAFSFQARAEGVPSFETLDAQYLNDAGEWVTVASAVSPGVNNDYVAFDGELANDFAYHSAKVRLVGANTAGSWIVDDFSVAPAVAPVLAPFADGFETGSLDADRWDDETSGTVDLRSGDFVMAMGNDAYALTQELPLLDLQALDQWAWFFMTGEGLGVGDVVTVEYSTEFVAWTTLDVIDVSGVGASDQGVEITLPLTAIGSNQFRMRITSSTGGGTVFVDDVHVGTSRLPDIDPGCSVADLAEPYGTLNFFDISAYISLFNAGDASADLAEPIGTLNFFDISEFIGQFNAGCP